MFGFLFDDWFTEVFQLQQSAMVISIMIFSSKFTDEPSSTRTAESYITRRGGPNWPFVLSLSDEQ